VKPAPFEYHAARSAAEAVELLARHADTAKVLAGGQSLVPMLNFRLARPGVLVDINGAADLDYLRESDGVLAVGALVRQRKLERWAADRAPLIAEALRLVGHVAIRNRGTAVGNLAHGDPASELPALLLCLDGAVVARRTGGERLIAAADLYLAPLTTSLAGDEILAEARFTMPPAGAGWGFAEVARRHGDFALAGCAALLWRDGEGRVAGVRIAFFGVGSTPLRGGAGEGLLLGLEPTPARVREAARAAAAALSPDGDLHATADYRRRVAGVLAERTLTAALERCAVGS
jgi:aerobic carbon-monoxide dehydrogenase medium subunit